MAGQLEVLSVGQGHLTLVITEGNEAEAARARQIINQMLRQGYAIFVEPAQGKPLERVKRFDPRHLVYIIDAEEPVAAGDEGGESAGGLQPGSGRPVTPPSSSRKGRGGRRLKATETKATVVGRTAGG